MTISIFANFLIDDEQRFLRLKESFYSFYKCNIQFWLVNIRGKYAKEVENFLIEHVNQDKLKIFFLHSKKGWFYDSRIMINYISTDYVFVWNEDHKNTLSYESFDTIIEEIKDNKIDNFTYSLFYNGDLYKSLLIDEAIEKKNIIYIDNNINLHQKRLNLIKEKKILGQEYIISLISICSTSLFKKIINSNDPPIKRWSKQKPFDFEKAPNDIHWLPFRFGVPNKEFFKCIDKEWDADGNRINYIPIKEKNWIKIFYKMFYIIFKFFFKKLIIFFREIVNNFISRKLKK